MTRARSSLERALLGCALFGAVLWAYWPALRGGWIWDDGNEITGNSAVQGGGAALRGIWLGRSGPDYFPLKTSLQWLEWRMFGPNPVGYHLVNLALHLASALLLWRLFVRLGLAVRAAWFGALVFAIHPVAVESVAWIAELKNALSLPLLLLAANAWVAAERGHVSTVDSAVRLPRGHLVSLAWYVAAALAKTTVVMFPVWLLVFAWYQHGRVRGRDVKRVAPFFGVSAVLGLLAVAFQQHRALQDQMVAIAPGPERVREAARAVLYYVGRCAVPWHSGPTFLSWKQSGWGWAVLTVLASGVAIILCWRHRAGWGRPALLALSWFGLNLLPVLGLVPMSYSRLSQVADHFAYLALLAVAGAAAAAAGWIAGRRGLGRTGFVGSGIGAVIGILLIAATRREARAYAGETAFWEAALRRNPDAWIAHSNLGLELLAEGRVAEAENHLSTAVRNGTAVPDTHNNHGKALGALGRTDEAIAEFQAALSLEPRFVDARINLGTALLAAGHPAAALAQYDQALAARPGSAAVQVDRGLALERLGRPDEAAEAYRSAIRAHPTEADAYYRWGNLLANAGQFDAAMTQYRAALRYRPDFAEAAADLGLALAESNRTEEAIGVLQSLVRLRPAFPEGHAYLGLALARAGRQPEAAGEYATALRGAPANADLHYQFGLTLQALGRSAEAQQQFETAQSLSRAR